MTNAIAAFAALFLWWFSTGLILWRVRSADNGSRDAHLISVLFGLPLLLIGAAGIAKTLNDPSTFGVYAAFLSALAVWGWIELAFLSGIITGPNRFPCPRGASEWERFVRAFGTLTYHEALLSAALFMIWLASQGAENRFALWTFGILFFARISAKLNLFLGVPRIHTEFLPKPLAHLPSHFRIAPMNSFFPLSVTGLTLASACWLERLIDAPDPAFAAGFSLLTALTMLALLEHWFMVLPLPDQKLWRWMIPAPKPITPDRLQEDAHGL